MSRIDLLYVPFFSEHPLSLFQRLMYVFSRMKVVYEKQKQCQSYLEKNVHSKVCREKSVLFISTMGCSMPIYFITRYFLDLILGFHALN